MSACEVACVCVYIRSLFVYVCRLFSHPPKDSKGQEWRGKWWKEVVRTQAAQDRASHISDISMRVAMFRYGKARSALQPYCIYKIICKNSYPCKPYFL